MSKKIRTRMTELLGIEVPVMQGGMQNLATPELAAAVSNAGGLGTINAASYKEPEAFRTAIRRLKELTDKPFCVNISMLPFVSVGEQTEAYFEVAAGEGVPVVETSGRNPEPYVPLLKAHGMKLIHKAPTVKHAKKAQKVGADLVSVVGVEGAGHPSMDEVSSLVLARKAARELTIPVLACGGFADGFGLAAALALGAEGVVLGTRFAACTECMLHPNYKAWMVEAQENSTVLIQRSIRNMVRTMNNQTARRVQEMEAQGAALEQLLPVISGQKGFQAQLAGDLDGGLFSIGQSVGLIDAIRPAGEIVRRMEAEAIQAIDLLRNRTEENTNDQGGT